MDQNEEKTCGLCNQKYTGWGNNSQPLSENAEDFRCCDECNDRYVTPARMCGVAYGSAEYRFMLQMIQFGSMFAAMRKRVTAAATKLEALKDFDPSVPF